MVTANQPTPSDTWSVLEVGLSLPAVAANDTQRPRQSMTTSAMPALDWLTPKGDGERTQAVAARAGHLMALGIPIAEVTEICLLWNGRNTPPLGEEKVISTCLSIAQTDARNHPNRAQRRLALAQEAGPLTPLFSIAEAEVGKYLVLAPPARRWVLKEFLQLGITATIVSPGGVGKSQFLMQLGYSVATGIPLCGHWAIGEEGAVLMLCAEDSEEEIHRRVHRIHRQLGQSNSGDIGTKLTSNLFVRSTIGEDMLLTKASGHGSELSRTPIADRLAMTVAQLAAVKLIILDPGARFRGGEENSNDHGTRFVEALEYIGKLTGATVLVAHHAAKGAAKSKDGPSQNDSRGASSLTDGVRWQMVLTSITAGHKDFKTLQASAPGHYVEAALVKTNYTAPQPSVHLRREADGYLQAVTAAPAAPSSNSTLMQLLAVVANAPQPLTAKEIEVNYCGKGKSIQVGQRASRTLIETARKAGLIQGHGLWPLGLTIAGKTTLGMQAASAAPGAAARPAAKRQSGKVPKQALPPESA